MSAWGWQACESGQQASSSRLTKDSISAVKPHLASWSATYAPTGLLMSSCRQKHIHTQQLPSSTFEQLHKRLKGRCRDRQCLGEHLDWLCLYLSVADRSTGRQADRQTDRQADCSAYLDRGQVIHEGSQRQRNKDADLQAGRQIAGDRHAGRLQYIP